MNTTEDIACVGRFFHGDRMYPCTECVKCKRHLDALYHGAPMPMYQSPKSCRKKFKQKKK